MDTPVPLVERADQDRGATHGAAERAIGARCGQPGGFGLGVGFGALDRLRELSEPDPIRAQEDEQRVPAKTTVAALDFGDERGADADRIGRPHLSEPGAAAKLAQRATKSPIFGCVRKLRTSHKVELPLAVEFC